ncbi:MAG: metal ABC transporter permease [Actinomycetia bacterium]|nr:metal ABC transporter permease [Actinomycetes bacterium]
MEVLRYPFMQRALLAAVLTGLMAPAIGTYIVQRRLSLLGDGLGHVALAGVGLAFVTGLAPLPVAVVVAVAGAVVIELLRQRGKATGDLGLAIVFYGGLAAGVLLTGLAGRGAATLSGYLFGALTTVSTEDLVLVGILAAVVLVATVGLRARLLAVSADEDFAKTMGLRVSGYNLLVVVLASITVTTAMRTVGLLLVSALMVVPVATAQNLFRSFGTGLFAAMGTGVAVALLGVLGSHQLDVAPGALIVLLGIAVFAVSWPLSTWLHRRARAVLPGAPAPGPRHDGEQRPAHPFPTVPADQLAPGDH